MRTFVRNFFPMENFPNYSMQLQIIDTVGPVVVDVRSSLHQLRVGRESSVPDSRHHGDVVGELHLDLQH